MQPTPQEKITECINDARHYFGINEPNIEIEHNFDTILDPRWFQGFKNKHVDKMEKNTARYTYKLG